MKTTQLILGLLASTAIARTTFSRSNDPCKDKYDLCKAPKDPKMAQDANGKTLSAAQLELKCNCEQAACLGEDNARNREYCDKVKKNNWIDPDAPKPPSDSCKDKYDLCKAPKDPKMAQDANGKPLCAAQLELKCNCEQAACLGEDNARNREYCDKVKKNNWVDPDAPKRRDDCQDKYQMCKNPTDPKEANDPNGKKYNEKQLEHKCNCGLQACVGEDNQRARDYCEKLKNNNWVDVDAGESADTCQDKYQMCKNPTDPKEANDPNGKKYNEKQLEHKCNCGLQACVGEDNQRARDYCEKLKNNNWVDVDAGEKPPQLL
ncbi:hypothetical protein AC578_9156 [Pseudocercospora eumusae]|uniref:Uncharacterized protein n=1 Tax=Pseudocercospora eumusae TaxID=321146 RepID=A0A139HUZ7_9PEZI|nr:hypothetical protein AC578_9156 [Pseudocercospora eumusae]